ncbi:polymer-forming cytoskeletal protein, partial [Candidatus Parcubacteria bacterium]|nr:polymer-forming cytoskeletal protein [Candidatus Parcubacteria bacterium]
KISGEVTGNLKIKGYLELSATAKVTGDIEAVSMSIERGAILNGKCAMSAEGKGSAQETEKKES